MKSKFGKGFIYPLGLYMMHLERIADAKNSIAFMIAVHGAYDHLRELNIPKDLPKNIQKEIKYLSNRLYQHCNTLHFFKKVPNDRDRIVYQSKSILFNIDKYYNNEPSRGEIE